MRKACTNCDGDKESSEFYRRKSSSDGLNSWCKTCSNLARNTAQNSLRGREAARRHNRTYRQSGKGQETRRSFSESDAGKEAKRRYSQSEKGKLKAYQWRQSDRGKASRRCSHRRRMTEDPAYRIRTSVSAIVRNAVRGRGGSKAGQSTFKHLSYTSQQLVEHLELLWEPWMNWGNYGLGVGCWTIDHIVPQSLFRYTSLEDPAFQECWALSNLRPLEFIANIRKGAKI